jgi:hypothetical protein
MSRQQATANNRSLRSEAAPEARRASSIFWGSVQFSRSASFTASPPPNSNPGTT